MSRTTILFKVKHRLAGKHKPDHISEGLQVVGALVQYALTMVAQNMPASDSIAPELDAEAEAELAAALSLLCSILAPE